MKFEVYYQDETDDASNTILEFSAKDFTEAIKVVEENLPSDGRTWVLQRRGGNKILSGAREDLLAQIRCGKAKFKKARRRGKKRDTTEVDIDRAADERLERFLAELPED